jgi:hypothetical protein
MPCFQSINNPKNIGTLFKFSCILRKDGLELIGSCEFSHCVLRTRHKSPCLQLRPGGEGMWRP